MAEMGATLVKDTWEGTRKRAQRILDIRGRPPYVEDTFNPEAGTRGSPVSADEAHVLSEFVQFWMPFLVEKEKIK